MLTTRTINSPLLKELLSENELHGSSQGVALSLLHERLTMLRETYNNDKHTESSSSRWAEYISCMPHAVSLPFMYTDDQLHILKGTDCYCRAMKLRARILEKWNSTSGEIAMRIFYDIYQETEPDWVRKSPYSLTLMLFQEFVYCISLVFSRAFSIDKYHGMGLCPFADLLNHSR